MCECVCLCAHHACGAPDVSRSAVPSSYQDLYGAVLSGLDILCEVLVLRDSEEEIGEREYKERGGRRKREERGARERREREGKEKGRERARERGERGDG